MATDPSEAFQTATDIPPAKPHSKIAYVTDDDEEAQSSTGITLVNRLSRTGSATVITTMTNAHSHGNANEHGQTAVAAAAAVAAGNTTPCVAASDTSSQEAVEEVKNDLATATGSSEAVESSHDTATDPITHDVKNHVTNNSVQDTDQQCHHSRDDSHEETRDHHPGKQPSAERDTEPDSARVDDPRGADVDDIGDCLINGEQEDEGTEEITEGMRGMSLEDENAKDDSLTEDGSQTVMTENNGSTLGEDENEQQEPPASMSNQTTNDASVSELHDRLSELHEPSSATGQVPSSLTSPQPPQPQRPSQLPSQPQSPQRRKVWESDRQASECRRCGRRFNFLVRRHHCRRCGQIVCDKCSSHRVRLPADEIVEDPMVSTAHYTIIAMQPQRVCDACIRLPLKADPDTRSSHPLNIRNAMKRTSSSQSLMSECPVCGHDLLGMRKTDQERHLQQCLNTGSPPVHLPRYIVYKLSADSPQINEECPICFDEFQVGDKIARMVCLCSFHHQCLSDWLQRGRGCPVHYDASFAS